MVEFWSNFDQKNRYFDQKSKSIFSKKHISKFFKDSTPRVPLIFILSAGSEPMNDVTRLAETYNMLAKIVPISLGQGQGPKATAGIKDGALNGKWMALSWAVDLIKIWRFLIKIWQF